MMAKRRDYFIGLDVGTTGCKAVALAANGELLGHATGGYPLISKQPGQAEQDVEAIWQAVARVLIRLGEEAPTAGARALCLGGAMHSLLPVAADGQPLARAVTWADTRAAPYADRLVEVAAEDELYRRTGCRVHAVYYPARLRWHQAEGAPGDSDLFVGIKTWLLHRLTGQWALDWAMASTTGLLDIHTRQWYAPALELAGVSASQLPPLVAPSDRVGVLQEAAAAATGLPAGLPVIAGAHDGGLANIGAEADVPGAAAISVGTSGAVRVVADRPVFDPMRRSWCYLLLPERWLVGGAINNGGLAVAWVRDHFYGDVVGDWRARSRQLMREAERAPAGANGLIFLPYLAGERTPHWDSSARATLHGLTLAHGRAHVARAVLESVAFCLRDVGEALHDAGAPLETDEAVPLTGSIANHPTWVQIVTNVLGVEVRALPGVDASAVGAAVLGAAAMGVSLKPRRMLPAPAVYEPDPAQREVYREQYSAFKELYGRVHDVNARAHRNT